MEKKSNKSSNSYPYSEDKKKKNKKQKTNKQTNNNDYLTSISKPKTGNTLIGLIFSL